jgi:hypothetical protein
MQTIGTKGGNIMDIFNINSGEREAGATAVFSQWHQGHVGQHSKRVHFQPSSSGLVLHLRCPQQSGHDYNVAG